MIAQRITIMTVDQWEWQANLIPLLVCASSSMNGCELEDPIGIDGCQHWAFHISGQLPSLGK